MIPIIYWDFHKESDVANVGYEYHPSSGNLMVIEIDGTSNDFQVTFEAKGQINNTWHLLKCANLSTITLNTSATTKSIWQVDLSGLTSFRVNLVTLNNGNISVRGKVVEV